MKMIHMSCPGHPEATLEGYLLDCETAFGQHKTRPAVIVCPGGGYVYLSPREGEPVALRYASKGFHAFILRYSVGFDAREFVWNDDLIVYKNDSHHFYKLSHSKADAKRAAY